MYRNGILALLVALGVAGWSEAQTPTVRMPSTNMPTVNPATVRQASPNLGTQAQGTTPQNGNPSLAPSTPMTMPLRTGNSALPPSMQVMPPQNPALGVQPVIPQGSQANVPLQGNGNTFTVNGASGQQPLFTPLGLQTNYQLQRSLGTSTAQPAFNPLGLQTNAQLQGSGNTLGSNGGGVSGQINSNTSTSSNGVSPRR